MNLKNDNFDVKVRKSTKPKLNPNQNLITFPEKTNLQLT